MFELIRLNKRKSLVLFILMGVCLVLIGFFVGASWLGPDGGTLGIIGAMILWLILSAVSYFQGDSIFLSMSGAREVTPESHQQLYNVVEEMKISAGLPAMPKVYVIDTPAMNAFATGRSPEKCAVAVTTGLLQRLNRDELQGVIAHEVSHIHNRDILFMTFAGVMLGAIVLISDIYVRGMFFSGGRRRSRDSGKGGGQAQAIIMVLALVFVILAPILANLLYLAISRKREYLADASAARLTRYPEGLASALEKIGGCKEEMASANKVTAPMFIAPPLKRMGKRLTELTSTHPPIEERVRILRSIGRGASGYLEYEEAYRNVTGTRAGLIPKSALRKESAPSAATSA